MALTQQELKNFRQEENDAHALHLMFYRIWRPTYWAWLNENHIEHSLENMKTFYIGRYGEPKTFNK